MEADSTPACGRDRTHRRLRTPRDETDPDATAKARVRVGFEECRRASPAIGSAGYSRTHPLAGPAGGTRGAPAAAGPARGTGPAARPAGRTRGAPAAVGPARVTRPGPAARPAGGIRGTPAAVGPARVTRAGPVARRAGGAPARAEAGRATAPGWRSPRRADRQHRRAHRQMGRKTVRRRAANRCGQASNMTAAPAEPQRIGHGLLFSLVRGGARSTHRAETAR
jgi:hypothetical protein